MSLIDKLYKTNVEERQMIPIESLRKLQEVEGFPGRALTSKANMLRCNAMRSYFRHLLLFRTFIDGVQTCRRRFLHADDAWFDVCCDDDICCG